MHGPCHDNTVGSAGCSTAHQNRFDRRRGSVIKACIGDIHARQAANERLVLEHGLKITLTHLRLIRCVTRVKLAPSGQIIDHCGNKMVVGSPSEETEVRLRRLIFG